MLSVLVAKTVADALEPKGIYDLVIELNQLPYLDSKHEYLWGNLQINDVVSSSRPRRIQPQIFLDFTRRRNHQTGSEKYDTKLTCTTPELDLLWCGRQWVPNSAQRCERRRDAYGWLHWFQRTRACTQFVFIHRPFIRLSIILARFGD